MKNILCVLTLLSAASVSNAENLDACKAIADIQLDMNVIASNIANVNTTRTPEGGPYQRQSLFCDRHFCEIVASHASLIKYEPGHPDADDDGYVQYPDIELAEEISAIITATRAYEVAAMHCDSLSVSE